MNHRPPTSTSPLARAARILAVVALLGVLVATGVALRSTASADRSTDARSALAPPAADVAADSSTGSTSSTTTGPTSTTDPTSTTAPPSTDPTSTTLPPVTVPPVPLAITDPTPAQLLADAAPSIPTGWMDYVRSVVVGGVTREYLVVEPRNPVGMLPVVVLLAGHFMTADGVLRISGLARQLGPAVLIVPEGWHRSWDAGGCCGLAYVDHRHDVAFVRLALEQVLATTPQADAGRVYAVGFSNGGRMAYRLACQLPGEFAGIAVAEAVPVAPCAALHPLDVAIIAQTGDPLLSVVPGEPIRWVDGHPEPTVSATVDRWRQLDGCASTSLATTVAGFATVERWQCAGGTSLEYVEYPGGRHDWRTADTSTPGATDVVVGLIRGRDSATV